MLNKTTPCFILIPNPMNERLLREGKVLELENNRPVIEFAEAINLPAGTDVQLYAEFKGKFFQQAAKIESFRTLSPASTIEFTLIGEAVSAESRGSFRVSTVALELPVTIDKRIPCILADVSPEGIGIISSKLICLATFVQVGLSIDGIVVDGRFKVQTQKKLPSGKFRYGLFSPDRKSEERKALGKLTIAMQRQQLRRLAGAA